MQNRWLLPKLAEPRLECESEMVARKRFGQNFLHDKNIIRKIITSINPQKSDHIIEIGPGRGALTDELVKLTDNLQVIEIDRDLISVLRGKYADSITIHEADVLKLDFSAMFPQGICKEPQNVCESDRKAVRIVGNLPYNISTPLLFKLFEYTHCIKDMFFMLQLEVVDRICAVPSTKEYGRLSIMSHYFSHAEKLFQVPASAFSPQPKVTSAVIRLTPKADIRTEPTSKLLNQMVVSAFSKRRKTLRNALSDFLSDEDFSALNINPKYRPENLSLDEYLKCVDHLITKRMGSA